MYKSEEYAALMGTMQPRYPLVKGLTNNAVIKAVNQAIMNVGTIEEFVPDDILKRLELISFSDAVREIHFPQNSEKLEKARRRLAYNEFLLFVLKCYKMNDMILLAYDAIEFLHTNLFN